MARRESRLETAGTRRETRSKHRDVCVLIPRPSRPLFIGFRCRILRQTLSHRAPPSRRPGELSSPLSLSSFLSSPLLYRVAFRSHARVRVFILPSAIPPSPPPCVTHSHAAFFQPPFSFLSTRYALAKPAHAEICRASNKSTRYAWRVNRMNANARLWRTLPRFLSSSLPPQLPLFHPTKVSDRGRVRKRALLARYENIRMQF